MRLLDEARAMRRLGGRYLRARVVLFGDCGVGKTTLVNTLEGQRFHPQEPTLSTIGVEFTTRWAEARGELLRLQLWDTGGQEVLQAITRTYYRHAAAGLLCYAAGRADTVALARQLRAFREVAGDGTRVTLVVTQWDKARDPEAEGRDAEALCRTLGLEEWFATSATDRGSIEHLVLSTAAAVAHDVHDGRVDAVPESAAPPPGPQGCGVVFVHTVRRPEPPTFAELEADDSPSYFIPCCNLL